MRKKFVLKRFKTDLDIYKANGDYDKQKIKNIDIEKVNFTYGNAVAYMQEIDDDVKIINTRATLLLGYLAAIIAALVVVVFGGQDHSITPYIKNSAAILLGVYLVNIFIIAVNLISPSFGARVNNEPESLMTQDIFQYDMKLIKIIATEVLQNRIKYNTNRLEELAWWLKNCIFLTFLGIPFALLLALPQHLF